MITKATFKDIPQLKVLTGNNTFKLFVRLIFEDCFIIKGNQGCVFVCNNSINGLYVLPDLQNLGLGSKLLKYAERHLFSRYLKIRLYCKPETILFYKKNNYRIERLLLTKCQ